MDIQYSKAVDSVIYSKATKDFTKEEWLSLSVAARDQAGAQGQDHAMPKMRLAHETVYSNGDLTFSLADIQHIEHLKGSNKEPNGLHLITQHTQWDNDRDQWENPIYIPQKKAEEVLAIWCRFRSEIDPVQQGAP